MADALYPSKFREFSLFNRNIQNKEMSVIQKDIFIKNNPNKIN